LIEYLHANRRMLVNYRLRRHLGLPFFDRFRGERGQRDLVKAHDQEAANAMEQMDATTFS
jgi:hypothetical protein